MAATALRTNSIPLAEEGKEEADAPKHNQQHTCIAPLATLHLARVRDLYMWGRVHPCCRRVRQQRLFSGKRSVAPTIVWWRFAERASRKPFGFQ
mmetsp:Transcript_48955/g.104248  ORF Transcript_48955/g.104248 Transcript_48955/m.104248 type:complete len:94 (-) Transcript_48955:1228-1509(-)